MTSRRQIQANRANARRSTGPKTAAGKRRAARNALRHGLSCAIEQDPEACAQTEDLAQTLVSALIAPGARARSEGVALTRAVARAVIQIQRVRRHRHALILDGLTDPMFMPEKESNRQLALSIAALRAKHAGRGVGRFGAALCSITPPQGPAKPAIVVADVVHRLRRLDRYEQRARQQLRRALQAFIAWKVETASAARVQP